MLTMATPAAGSPSASRVSARREAVSIKTAAQLLDVHADTIRRLIKGGKLRAFRVGRVWRIHRAALSEAAWRRC